MSVPRRPSSTDNWDEKLAAIREAAEAASRFDQPVSAGRIRVVGLPPPPPVELFHGRNAEIKRIEEYLFKRKVVRIVAIVGQTGMGKTALARKVLRKLAQGGLSAAGGQPIGGIVYMSTYTSGISFERLFFDCAELLGGDAEKELEDIWKNNTLGVVEKARRLIQALKRQGDRRSEDYFILVDNLEDQLDRGQIKDAGLKSFFDQLRLEENQEEDQPKRAHLLVTSREDLNYSDGQGYLSLPLDHGLRSDESVSLLRDLDPEEQLGLSDAATPALEDLANAALRIPRALELISSILAHSPCMLLKTLQARLEAVPHGEGEGERDRQKRIVEDLSQMNYDALTAGERQVVEALAVYECPVPVVAVEFLLAQIAPDADVPATIEGLRQMHAISYETEVENLPPGGALLALHPVDQQIVRKQISLEKICTYNLIAADYYRRIRHTSRARIALLAPQLREYRHRLLALDYLGALTVLDDIDYSLVNQHKYRASLMALGYGREAIEKRRELHHRLGNPGAEARNLTSLAWVCRRMGENAAAEGYFREAVRLAEASTDVIAQIYALSEFGYFLTDNAGQHAEAEIKLQQSLKLAMEAGDRYLEAHARLGLAFVEYQRGNNASALAQAGDARAQFHEVPDDYHGQLARFREIDCLVRLNMTHRKLMDYTSSYDVTQQALAIADQKGLVDWQAELNSQSGFNDREAGDYEGTTIGTGAIAHHARALELFKEQHGMKREEAVQYSYLGNLYADLGQFNEADHCYKMAEDIAETIGIRRELSWILSTTGILLCRQGLYDAACEIQSRALKLISDTDAENQPRRYRHFDSATIRLTDLAASYFAQESYTEALHCILEALYPAGDPDSLPAGYLTTANTEDALPHEMQSPGDHQRRGALLARIYLETSNLDDALRVIEEARRHDAIAHCSYTAALHGVICARLGRRAEAQALFAESLTYAQRMLTKTDRFYEAHYARGLARAGLAVMNGADAQAAEVAYRAALEKCDARGVVDDAARLLKALQLVAPENSLAPLREILKHHES